MPGKNKIISVRIEQGTSPVFAGGNLSVYGTIAKAVVQSTAGGKQTLRSPGRWCLAHSKQNNQGELGELRKELEAFGFGKRAIDYAFKNVSHTNE